MHQGCMVFLMCIKGVSKVCQGVSRGRQGYVKTCRGCNKARLRGYQG